MAVSGLGQDGYVRIQKETTWGTPLTNSMTLLPALPGSTFETVDLNIENSNVISSRVKQVPDIGRQTVKFSLQLNLPFTLIGVLLNLLLGTSADSAGASSTYTHTWLVPITGLRVGKSFTMQVAKGGDTAEQFDGCVFSSIKFVFDNQGQIIVTLDGVGKSYTENVARISSFTYPTAIPGNFGMTVLNIDPADASAFDQPCNSIDFSLDLGYELENFKTGSRFINNPIFNTIPNTMLNCDIDADRQFGVAAHAHTLYDHVLTITSNEFAGGAVPYKVEIEIPKALLSPETSTPFENDRLTMSLAFDCSYGGATTGSSSAVVQAEFRVVDATAAYA